VSPTKWLEIISKDPKDSEITISIHPNEFDIIDYSTINLYVSMIIFLMNMIPSVDTDKIDLKSKPKTPEQRAIEAKNRALIGQKGEELVFKKEYERLESQKINPNNFLKHMSKLSDGFGYDILSCDKYKNELFIEVKTTTRSKEDPNSRIFHMSSNEYDFYKKNKKNYQLLRVYDIKGENPEIVEVDMETVLKEIESYLMKIKI